MKRFAKLLPFPRVSVGSEEAMPMQGRPLQLLYIRNLSMSVAHPRKELVHLPAQPNLARCHRQAFYSAALFPKETVRRLKCPALGKSLGRGAPFGRVSALAGREGIGRMAADDEGVFFDTHTPQSQALRSDAAKFDHGERHSLQETTVNEEENPIAGSIHVIVGPMFAGKTTALLNRVQVELSAGRRVAMVKSEKDTRYGLNAVVSHDGIQMPCLAVPNLAAFRNKIGEEAYKKLDVVGIDEAHFFKDLYSFCQIAADHEGKTVIVAGLDGDFLRKSFGSILDLIPLADTIVKLSSHCELCGKAAHFTFRKTDDMNKEVIGGKDVYMPVCRQHYLSGQIAMENARTVLHAHKFVTSQCDQFTRKGSEE